jgi:hypothetical protein
MADRWKIFRDRQITVHDFAMDVLIVCPRCARPARVFATDDTESFYRARQWRTVCPSCGHHQDKTSNCRTIYTGRRGGVADPVFGLPLWLQKSCCSGKLLWACNLEHLSFVESFVAATIRERSDAVRAGDGYRRMSMVAKLPSWLKSAKHRDEILKVMLQLKQNVTPVP